MTHGVTPGGGRTTTVTQSAGFFMLRAPLLPVTAYVDLTVAASDGGGPGSADPGVADPRRGAPLTAEETRARLREFADSPLGRRALAVASDSVTTNLDRFDRLPAKKADRLYSALFRYATRMSTRPTPYGAFAGVAFGEFGAANDLALADDPVARIRTRADLGWLLDVIRIVEVDRQAAATVPAMINPMLYRTGDRAVLPYTDVHGTRKRGGADFRVTAPVLAALELAGQGGSTLADIEEHLARRFENAPRERIRNLLEQLWDTHVLLSELRPSLSSFLPDVDLIKRLNGAGPLTESLTEIRTLAARTDTAPVEEFPDRLRAMAQAQKALTPDYKGETIQIDTALAVTGGRLAEEVGAAAASAVEVLSRITDRARMRRLVQFQQVFQERYGIDAEVPVLDVLSPERGIDAPDGYETPPRTYPLPPIAPHDDQPFQTALATMLVEVFAAGETELELTEERIQRLTEALGPVEAVHTARAVEVYAQLAAPSLAAVAEGDFRLILPAGAMVVPGGRTFGRFCDLFAESDVERLREYLAHEEAACPDTVFAELNYLPTDGHQGNVMIHPVLREYEICVNSAPSLPPERRIPLSDILLGATGGRLYLRSRRLGKELVVTQSHMLNAFPAPNVCRFLLDVSGDGVAWPEPFGWGGLRSTPFLPRVTHGKVVLSPAYWRLTTKMISADLDASAFAEAVLAWRERHRVPRHVYLTEADNRLLLDLDQPTCVEELRADLKRGGSVSLSEMLPAFDELWLRDGRNRPYLNEVVVPVLTTGGDTITRVTPVTPDRPLPESRRLPVGSQWLHVKLYSAFSQHDDVLVQGLPDLLSELFDAGLIDRWFFIRYLDTRPHLRLRFHIPADAGPEVFGEVVARVTTGLREIVDAGFADDFALVSYDREIERYGGPIAIDEVERVFEANSDCVISLLELVRREKLDPDIVHVAAMHAFAVAWGIDPIAEIAVDKELKIDDDNRARFREVQAILCELLSPWEQRPHEAANPYREAMAPVLERQTEVITDVMNRLRPMESRGELSMPTREILESLLHMHANRFLGPEREREITGQDLWALARRTIQRRPR